MAAALQALFYRIHAFAGALSILYKSPVRRPGGRAAGFDARRGKSGLHGETVPGNARRGRPQGQCHRKQTARGPFGRGSG